MSFYQTQQYPRPSLTVDAAVFRRVNDEDQILLIERKFPPYQNKWALPGGFVDMDETLEQSVARELDEETRLKGVELRQIKAFSSVERDPRGRTVSVIFWGEISEKVTTKAGDDAARTKWFNLTALPELAFDHQEVVEAAIYARNQYRNQKQLL